MQTLIFHNPKNTTTDKLLPRRAKQHGSVKISGDVLSVADAGIEIAASGKRFDDVSNSRALPGYTLFSIYASKVVMPGLRLGARIENATNREYQLAYGYACRWSSGVGNARVRSVMQLRSQISSSVQTRVARTGTRARPSAFFVLALCAWLVAIFLAANEAVAADAAGPQRIVSLSPHATELLFAAGAGRNVVGVTESCDRPAAVKRLPK